LRTPPQRGTARRGADDDSDRFAPFGGQRLVRIDDNDRLVGRDDPLTGFRVVPIEGLAEPLGEGRAGETVDDGLGLVRQALVPLLVHDDQHGRRAERRRALAACRTEVLDVRAT
jgi:hypothetical protein